MQIIAKTVAPLAIAAVALVAALASGSGSVAYAQAAVSGPVLFQQRCAMCHSMTKNGVGPNLSKVVGRKAASEAGYSYSPALLKSGLTWTPAQLDTFLTAPQKAVPGTKMPISLPDPVQRKAIIAYLTSGK